MNSRHASFISLLNPFLQYKYMITVINMWIPRSGPRPAWRYIQWKLAPVVLTQKRKLRLKPQWMQWMIQSPGQGQGILLTSYSAASGREFLFWFNFTADGLIADGGCLEFGSLVTHRVDWSSNAMCMDLPTRWTTECIVGHIIPNETRVCRCGRFNDNILSYVSKVKSNNITSFHWRMLKAVQQNNNINKTQYSVSITAPNVQFVHPIMVHGLDPLRKLGRGHSQRWGKV